MRIHPVCQAELRSQVALELRNSFDLWQNSRVHSFLISSVLLCNLIFPLLHVEDLILLVPGLLLEVSIGQVFVDCNLADRGGDDRVLVCSVQRNLDEGKRLSHKQ